MKALAVLVALTATAAAESRPHYGGSVEATLLGAPASLDPVAARTHAEATVASLVFDTLYRVGADGTPQPHLAAGDPVMDGTTAKIALRRNVRFHDGTTISAADVASSLDRARTAVPWLLPAVASIRPTADGIELTLRAPLAPADLAALLALPQASVTRAGKPPGAKPVGSGPFAVDTFDRAKRRLALRAFDDHFAGRPYVDALVLRWYDTPDAEARRFETGNAQISARGAAAFAGGQPSFRTHDVEGPASVLAFVGFGAAHAAITGDRGFRRALDLALARGALTAIGSGERVVPTREPVPVEAGAVPLAPAARNADIAAATAQLATVAKKITGQKLELLVEDTRPDDRELAERVVLALDKLGIAVTITPVAAAVLRERVEKGQADLWIGQLALPATQASLWWAAAFGAGHDDWPIASLQAGALDPAAAAKAFSERMPIVPLMFRSVRLWHRTDVRGVAFDASGRPDYADLFLFGAPTPTRKP